MGVPDLGVCWEREREREALFSSVSTLHGFAVLELSPSFCLKKAPTCLDRAENTCVELARAKNTRARWSRVKTSRALYTRAGTSRDIDTRAEGSRARVARARSARVTCARQECFTWNIVWRDIDTRASGTRDRSTHVGSYTFVWGVRTALQRVIRSRCPTLPYVVSDRTHPQYVV